MKATTLYLSALSFKIACFCLIKCDSDRDRILLNPFLQGNFNKQIAAAIQTNEDSTEDRLSSNPFLQKQPLSVTSHVSVTNNNHFSEPGKSPLIDEEEDYRLTKFRLQTNPFINGGGTGPQPEKVPETIAHHPKYLLSEFDAICGITTSLETGIVQLIANGDTVSRHYPWLVAIYRLTENSPVYQCGGTLISKKHMISAAHCFPPFVKDIDEYQFVITNNLQRKEDTNNRIVKEALEVHKHPGYLPRHSDADIAVVVFRTEVEFNDKIRPICLWAVGSNNLEDIINDKGVIVGWGTDENNVQSRALPKQASLPIITSVDCIRDNTKFTGIVGHNSFCAGYKKDTGPCPGDSGSGFIIEKDGRWNLRGIISATLLVDKNICDITDYTAMTDVAKYSTWILKIVSG